MTTVRLTIHAVYEITDDLNHRAHAYRTLDPGECARLDWDADPMMVLLESDSEVVDVQVLEDDA